MVWLWVALGVLWYAPGPARLLTPDSIDTLAYAACLSAHFQALFDASQSAPAACPGANHWSPGLPAVLAAVRGFGLDPLVWMRWISLMSAALMPLPLFVLGRALAGHRVGQWAAFLSLSLVWLRLYSLLPDARMPALLCTFSAYAALVRWAEQRGSQRLLWSGLLAGLAAALRPEGRLVVVLCAVGLVLELLWAPRGLLPARSGPAGSRGPAGPAPSASGSSEDGPMAGADQTVDAGTGQAHLRWAGILRQGLGPLLRRLGLLGTGFVVGTLPFQIMTTWITGRLSAEPRAWELPAIAWLPHVPLWLFQPLFDTGSQPTALRLRFQQALQAGQLELSAGSRLEVLWDSTQQNLPRLLQMLAQSLSLELALGSLVGLVLLALSRDRWPRLLLWLLPLSPTLPLLALPQSFNPRLPEGNFLFIPMTLVLACAVTAATLQTRGLAWAGNKRRPRIVVWMGLVTLGLGWTLQGGLEYVRLLEWRGGTLFESSPEVSQAALWLELNSAPSRRVRTTYAGQAVALLAGRPRLPWPSAWEIPAWASGKLQREEARLRLEPLQPLRRVRPPPERPSTQTAALAQTSNPALSGPSSELIVLTSIDLADNALAVRAWERLDPPLRLLHHEEGQGGLWIAILEWPGERRTELEGQPHEGPPQPVMPP